ncbi:MAG: MBL fold metallo-hydrolase [Acidobacteria bacterium]|nr:MBL fold metallo-hydrolase [Acidobacteriota bacterium]
MRVPLFRFVALVFSAVVIAGCSAPQTGEAGAQQALDDAAEAMGGWDALRAIQAQRIASEGSSWEPTQGIQPGETRQVNSFSETMIADFGRSAVRIAFDGKRMYPAAGPLTFTEIIDGQNGALEQADAAGLVSPVRLHPSRHATRLRDLNRLPARVLIAASQAAGLDRVADRTIDGTTYRVVTYRDAGQTAELLIEVSTNLPARAAYMEDDPLLGDTRNEWVWSEWREVGGVRLPHTEERQLNGLLIRRTTVSEVQNNPAIPANTFAIAAEVLQQPEVGERIASEWTLRRAAMGVGFQEFARPQNVEIEMVAPGVYHARGGGHHSMIVEMADHLMVIEAPLFEERSRAVINAIKERVPGKPIRYVMMTHHHNDHSGGIRAYAAEGATVIAHASIVPFVQSVLTHPKTIRPDALALVQAKAGSAANANVAIDGVSARKEYTDGRRVVQVYPIPNEHAESMLAAYLPAERIIFVSDLYSPAPGGKVDPSNANARAFYTAVTKLGLNVDRVVGGHGVVGRFRDLAAVMATS